MALHTALLIGGRSSRMGSDKAALRLGPAAEPLWQIQWRKLSALRPATAFLSVRPDQAGSPDFGTARVLPDRWPDIGPLGGILTALEEIGSHDLSGMLLVLAVDLPLISTDFLEDLVYESHDGIGRVVMRGGRYEPLAATYPVAMREAGHFLRRHGRHALHDFIREGIARGLMEAMPLGEHSPRLFSNLNTPDDLGTLREE